MSTPNEKLAESLEILHDLQKKQGIIAIKTSEISRTHRERLSKNGFLQEVTKGWYLGVQIEPNTDNDKVDIMWEYDEGEKKVVQVKSSINNFTNPEIVDWAKKLYADVQDAKKYEIILIGCK
jgi:hypothetical protein